MNRGGKRKGAGRKARPEPRQVITIRLEPKDAETFRDLCVARGASQATVFAELVRNASVKRAMNFEQKPLSALAKLQARAAKGSVHWRDARPNKKARVVIEFDSVWDSCEFYSTFREVVVYRTEDDWPKPE